MYDAPVKISRPLATDAPVFISCEHASNRVPDGIELTQRDRRLLDSHWGWDIGALDTAESIAELLEAPLVYSTYTRLLCDLNRDPTHDDLFRTKINGQPVPLNAGLSREQEARRFDALHQPYHATLRSLLTKHADKSPGVVMFSVHSFTPELDGEQREADIGIVFDDWIQGARQLKSVLESETGATVKLNEPYSGFESYIYSMSYHGTEADVRAFQLEFKNTTIAEDSSAVDMARDVVGALSQLSWIGD